MSEHDDFFERLRADAHPLRRRPDEVTLARIRARVLARIERPTVAQQLAGWFRPLIAAAAAIAAVAVFTLTTLDDEPAPFGSVEIEMAGDSYRVGH